MHLLTVIILAAQIAAGPPPADAVGVYARGVAAVKAGDWQNAITFMNAAIAIDPEPRTYREADETRDYYPQYYLFIAHSEIGEFEQALRFYLTKGGFHRAWPPTGNMLAQGSRRRCRRPGGRPSQRSHRNRRNPRDRRRQ
jgi:tetratricopeptide (TPR) repeat protein